MASDKEREQRISRLCRMAGNLLAGNVDRFTASWAVALAPADGGMMDEEGRIVIGHYEMAKWAVGLAVAIDAEVQRVCAPEPKEPA